MGRALPCLPGAPLLITKSVPWPEGWDCGLWKPDWLVWDFSILGAS